MPLPDLHAVMAGMEKEATSIVDMNPMLLMQLMRRLKRIRGARSRLFQRLIEARLHELENQQEAEKSKTRRKK